VHTTVFYLAVVWMTVLLGASVVLVIRAPSVLSRILSLDMVILIVVALLVLLTDSLRVSYYLDAALVLALLSLAATIAAARYHAEGRIFS
jgi:multisubunit Na+/H+ antiporter MnhF subunit